MLLIDFVRRCNFMLSIETAVKIYVMDYFCTTVKIYVVD